MVKKATNRKGGYVQLAKDSKGKAVLRSVSLKLLPVISIASFVLSFLFSTIRFTGYAISNSSSSAFSIIGVFLFLLGLTTLAIYFNLK
jgi:hypothetical protein